MTRVRVTGVAEVAKKLKSIRQNARSATADALNRSAQEVLAESSRQVPVDTGKLARSGRVVEASASNLMAGVMYGGPAAEYALQVHETHPSGSKYLESSARASAIRLRELLEGAIKSSTK